MATRAKPETQAERDARLLKAINDQGHPFQFSLLRAIHSLAEAGKCAWHFEAAEFPVEVKGQGTRVDFVLRANKFPYLMLAECKRCDPSYGDWVFSKSGYTRRNHDDAYIVDVVEKASGTVKSSGRILLYPEEDRFFHAGIWSNGGGRSPVEEAASQAIRSQSGMAEFFAANEQSVGELGHQVLIPVIFTTAKLYALNRQLADADPRTGRLTDESSFSERPFLLYQYHLSPGIKHSLEPLEKFKQISKVLAAEYIRTIAVVNAGGLEEFFAWFNPNLFEVNRVWSTID